MKQNDCKIINNSSKKNTEESPSSKVGNRVKSARMLSGHTRKSFADASSISMATLRAWEEPLPKRYGLTEKGAERLIEFLNICGILCTKEWLLLGAGPAANFIREPFNDCTDKSVWDEEESILNDISAFKKNNPTPVVIIVQDDSMMPIFKPNDYVGGTKVVNKEIKKLIGLNCIVEVSGKTVIRKIIMEKNNLYTLITLNQNHEIHASIMVDVKVESAAEIVWQRRRRFCK